MHVLVQKSNHFLVTIKVTCQCSLMVNPLWCDYLEEGVACSCKCALSRCTKHIVPYAPCARVITIRNLRFFGQAKKHTNTFFQTSGMPPLMSKKIRHDWCDKNMVKFGKKYHVFTATSTQTWLKEEPKVHHMAAMAPPHKRHISKQCHMGLFSLNPETRCLKKLILFWAIST